MTRPRLQSSQNFFSNEIQEHTVQLPSLGRVDENSPDFLKRNFGNFIRRLTHEPKELIKSSM